MQYAKVIVDLSAEAVDRLFTYTVPDGIILLPGFQVLVPFGPRTIEGFVVELSATCDIDPERVKPIIRPVRDYPVILPELMELAKWMQDRYHCNLVDALRLMLPAEMRGQRVQEKRLRYARCIAFKGEIDQFLSGNRRAKKQCELLLRLYNEGCVRTADIPEKSALSALVKRGLVEIALEEVSRIPKTLEGESDQPGPALTSDQARALEELKPAFDTGGGRFLLHGVTGSGKTEVYIQIVREALNRGKSAIVLVPEIALTPQMVSWFHRRFGQDAAVLHSGLSAGERYDEWRRIRRGEARVVIGARSAIFAPIEHIGAIVIDEEHEGSYHSDRTPCYDAREIAWERAKHSGAVLLLGSATPSVSTYMRAMPGIRPENRINLIEMSNRANLRPLPDVAVVDMRGELQRGNGSIFSRQLRQEMDLCLKAGHQAILFINRRGYSSFVSCRACGYVVKCPNCDVSLTYHQTENVLMCHYCGYTDALPQICPSCGSAYIKHFGIGTEKVLEAVRREFPTAVCLRMDNDTAHRKDAAQQIYNSFLNGQANVLVGTQMIAKGLDFPNVTLVGVVAADLTLNLPDYRSVERTFQLITQVAGRAGRGKYPGKVVIQTYEPEHYAIQLSAKQDYRAFYQRESMARRMGLYPPFTTILRLVYHGLDAESVEAAAVSAEEDIRAFLNQEGFMRDVIQIRALEAPIRLLRGETRWQVFVKMYFKGAIDQVAEKMRAMTEKKIEGVHAELEINPSNMF